MTNKTFIAFIIISVLASCDDSFRQNKSIQENPKALENKNDYSEIVTKRGYDDLVESLYSELLNKNGDLKNLEDRIRELNESKGDSTEVFNSFDGKNKNYYSAADRHIDQLSDSLLKISMKTLVSNSLAKYNLSIEKHKALLKGMEARNITLADLHIMLKIVKILPVIEKYQHSNLPSTRPIEGFIQKQNAVIKLADTLSK